MRSLAGRSCLALAAAALAACSIEGRSADFSCDGPGDCGGGRTCENGWCVLPGTGGGDDGGATPGDGGGEADAASAVDAAPAVCSEDVCDLCDNGTCVFLCSFGDACSAGIACPPGVPCRVVCNGVDSCAGGVDCTLASECTILCTKNGACAGPVACGSGRCDVTCNARDSCLAGVDCSESCSCTTNCSGANACGLGPECPDDACVAGDGDCTGGTGCDVCGG